MSDDEIYIAQGRTRAALKKLLIEVGGIKEELLRHSQELAGLSRSIHEFVQHPERRDAGALMPPASVLAHRLNHQIDLGSMAALIEELFQKSSEIQLLEERIKDF